MQRTQNVRGAAEQGQERSRKTERRLHLVQSEITFLFLRQGGSGVSVKVLARYAQKNTSGKARERFEQE